MSLLVHLSDFHLVPGKATQQRIFDTLVDGLRREHEAARTDSVAVVITGDVFASAFQATDESIEEFLRLHTRIVEALGGEAPTMIVPGNHDRRRFGFLGAQQAKLFLRLRDAVDARRVFVGGCDTPFLARVVPPSFHGLPAHVIAYDSTYVPAGLFGAGGTIRVEDLLMAHAQLPADGLPLIVLIHHHLIPTPLTDVSHIDPTGVPRAVRWLLDTALPKLVSYGDREELTMTALGAGTALSTLHSFGRAVLLLHGHKHMPTARLLGGLTQTCGDVLIASAGSAGTRERVHGARDPDAARLWPSFNRVNFTSGQVHVEALSFSPKHTGRQLVRRQLAQAARQGRKWTSEAVALPVRGATSRVALDEASYRLRPASARRWDFECTRRVELEPGARLKRYVDFVDALPDVLRGRVASRTTTRIELTLNGVTRYGFAGGLARNLEEGVAAHGVGNAFEWAGLLSRYGARHAVLRLERSGLEGLAPFASVTDLSTGRERPAPLVSSDDAWALSVQSCAPRTLLRIYWPLERE